MKLNVILDSHKDEILNLLLAISFWNRNEKQLKKINIIYIGSFNNWMLVQEYLKIIKSISNVKVSFFEIESISISKFKRIKNAILLYCKILILRIKSDVFFVPYDQRSFFYNFLYLLKCKSIAIPHTTGLEIYSKGTFNLKSRFSKNISILAKIPGCEEYFYSLGYSKLIYGGSYIDKFRKDKVFRELTQSSKTKKKLFLFTLHKISKQYTEDQWKLTHETIFKVLKKCQVYDIYLGGHPSQNSDELNELLSLANKFLINVTIFNCGSLKASNLSKLYISILTSAAQVPWLMGKNVCGFALPEMRQSVKNFGNDPYPYKAIEVLDFSNKIDLENWINNSKSNINIQSPFNNNKLELNEIIHHL